MQCHCVPKPSKYCASSIDEHWHIALVQLENELAEKADAIDKNTMMRMLAKSIVAYDKQSYSVEKLAEKLGESFTKVINDFELGANNQINTLAFEMKEELKRGLDENAKAIPSELARKASIASHAKTYAKREAIITYWHNNISADKSNEFAAELLHKAFPDVAHRTIVKYVSEAKKLPPASTL